ncbi:MAG: hypothetical protein EAZ58_05950 [Flavobacterium sp.]|nr:MAG: hypothetical protein EAZ58_05950 [Flavobacterium sp.]
MPYMVQKYVVQMKKIPSFLLVFIVSTAIAFSQARVVKVLDTHWKFQKGNVEDAFKTKVRSVFGIGWDHVDKLSINRASKLDSI